MSKYYYRIRKDIEYPIRWKSRIRNLLKSLILGWTPWEVRTEKGYCKARGFKHV